MNPLSIVPGILHSDDGIEFLHEQDIVLGVERIIMQKNCINMQLCEITREEMLHGISKENLREIGDKYEKFRREVK